MAAETNEKRSNGSNGNGAAAAAFDAELASHWNNLPSATKAAKILNVSLPRLNALVREGSLRAYPAPDGTKRFKPAWLQEFLADCESLPEEDDEQVADKKAAREGIPAEAIRATAELLKASQRQNLELHELVLKGFKAATEAQDVTIQRLLNRNERYEAVIEKLLEARENYFDAQLDRDMVRKQQQDAADRRSQMFDIVKANTGDLLDIIKKKVGGATDGETSEKLKAAVELLGGLEPEQIEVAAAMGFFSASQITLIEKILGRKVKIDPPKPETSGEQEQAK